MNWEIYLKTFTTAILLSVLSSQVDCKALEHQLHTQEILEHQSFIQENTISSTPGDSSVIGAIDNVLSKSDAESMSSFELEALHPILSTFIRHLLDLAGLAEENGPYTRLFQYVNKIIDNLTDIIESALETFINKVLEVKDIRLIESANNIKKLFLELKDEFQRLNLTINKQLHNIIANWNETLINNTENIDLWATNLKHDLRLVNNTQAYNETCKIIEDFVAQRILQLQKCCSITIKPSQSFCRDTRIVVAKVSYIVVHIVERIQICLEDKNSYLDYMVPCIKVALSDIISGIENISQLQRKLEFIFPIQFYYSKNCFAFVLVGVERRANMQKTTINEITE